MKLVDLIRLGLAGSDELRGRPASEVRRIKAQAGGGVRAAPLALPVGVKAVDKAKRIRRYAGSVEVVDRMGDLIVQDGWKTGHWKNAGHVFLWNHNTENPVGQGVDVWLGDARINSKGATAPALMFEIAYFDSKDSKIPFADVAWGLVSGEGTPTGKPVIRGSSVGFGMLDWESPSDEERKELGMPDYGLRLTAQDLHELSAAVVPANPIALETSGGRSLRRVDLAFRREMRQALDGMVDARVITRSLARAFEDEYGLSPLASLEQARARVKSFIDFGVRGSDDMDEDEDEREDEREIDEDEVREVDDDEDADDEDDEEREFDDEDEDEDEEDEDDEERSSGDDDSDDDDDDEERAEEEEDEDLDEDENEDEEEDERDADGDADDSDPGDEASGDDGDGDEDLEDVEDEDDDIEFDDDDDDDSDDDEDLDEDDDEDDEEERASDDDDDELEDDEEEDEEEGAKAADDASKAIERVFADLSTTVASTIERAIKESLAPLAPLAAARGTTSASTAGAAAAQDGSRSAASASASAPATTTAKRAAVTKAFESIERAMDELAAALEPLTVEPEQRAAATTTTTAATPATPPARGKSTDAARIAALEAEVRELRAKAQETSRPKSRRSTRRAMSVAASLLGGGRLI